MAKKKGRLLQQVIPSEDVGGDGLETPDKRSTKYVGRPGFSLPLMTTNFRRFNARSVIALCKFVPLPPMADFLR